MSQDLNVRSILCLYWFGAYDKLIRGVHRVRGMTKRQNKLLRMMIIESSWVAIRHDPALMLAYQKLVVRMKPNKAIIRIAKKIINRIRYVLKNQTPYVKAMVE